VGNRTASLLGQARQALLYGTAGRPLALVVPDVKHPGVMWRVALPDGRMSEMTSLTRAKDIAMAAAERGPPRRDFRLLHWRHNHLERPSAARWCAENVGGYPTANPRIPRPRCDRSRKGPAPRPGAGPSILSH
jgi:hypothetical protein